MSNVEYFKLNYPQQMMKFALFVWGFFFENILQTFKFQSKFSTVFFPYQKQIQIKGLGHLKSLL